jgi:hypothetical protein
MADSRAEDASVAPRRTLASPGGGGGKDRPVLPPLPEELKREQAEGPARDDGPSPVQKAVEKVKAVAARPAQKVAEKSAERSAERSDEPAPRRSTPRPEPRPVRPAAAAPKGTQRRSMRKARLRVVQVDAWSVMKTAFLLSIAIGIITVVAVAVVWGVLGAAGVWDSIDSMVRQTLGSDNSTPFHIQDYIGTSRVLGFTMIVAVVDVILITAISTLAAFVYNLAATLVGGIEVTLAEDM